MADEFCYSINDENFTGTDCTTREEAIAEAVDTYDLEPGAKVQTGRCVPYGEDAFLPSAEWILDRMAETAYDEGGDASDGWLDAVPKDQKDELEAEVHRVIIAWLKKHNRAPYFFHVADVQEHVVTAADIQA